MTLFHFRRLPEITCFFILALLLGACGGDSGQEEDRSFAPETQGETTLPTDTPVPTSTFAPIDIQPGESGQDSTDAAGLLNQTGPTAAMLSGLGSYESVEISSGTTTDLKLPRVATTLLALAPDGQKSVQIDRSSGKPVLRLRDAKGSETATWSPPDLATPETSPVSTSSTGQTGDRMSWSADSGHIAIWLSGVGLFLADASLELAQVQSDSIENVTALTWSPSGQSVAVALWNSDTSNASIVSIMISSQDAIPGMILSTAEGDSRFIRAIAWGNERVGIVFALRTVGSSSSLPNDLFMVPRFGQPMRLLASAGIAAPAAAVDQIAIASDGATIAFSVLVPGEVGLRLHSVWVTNAETPQPVRLDMAGLRRVSELAWSENGLVASGTKRSQDDAGFYQSAVVIRLLAADSEEIAARTSPATPIGAPAASPVAGTPEAED